MALLTTAIDQLVSAMKGDPNEFDFAQNKKDAEKLSTVNERIEFWLRKKRDAKQNMNSGRFVREWGYIPKVDAEVEYLKELLSGETSKSDSGMTDGREKNSTSKAQKAIAQIYVYENLDIFENEFKKDKDPFVRKKVIPHIIKELRITEKDCLSTRWLCQSLNWNKPE